MSNNTIEKSFVIEFGKEVHTVFQDAGQKLANCVRTVRNVKAKEKSFWNIVESHLSITYNNQRTGRLLFK